MIRKAPTAQKSYVYYRTEVLAALFNGVMLAIVIAFIYIEAVGRFLNPRPVNSIGVIFIGGAGLLVNLLAARLLHGKEHDLNLKGAYYHVLTDALGSVAALISGLLIYFTGWYAFDSLFSFIIGGLVFFNRCNVIRHSMNLL